MHPHIEQLLACIELEEKEEIIRYRLDQAHSLKQLKAEGLALHPHIITRKSFGYAEYPELSFRLQFPPEMHLFRDGVAIECFASGEEPVKGVLLSLDGKTGELRLYAPDFPDWIENDSMGIKLAPDTRTTAILKKVLQELEQKKLLFRLFEQIHSDTPDRLQQIAATDPSLISFNNQSLNKSQQQAVAAAISNEDLLIIHGPPGTGKTTTLTEVITQLTARGEKVAVCAPGNAAVDHLCKQLLQQGIRLLRVGNTSKVADELMAHTPEGKLSDSKLQKEIKQLKQRAEEFRRMALKYKRSFGKEEREQRNLLFREVKEIRAEIKKIQSYNEEKLYQEAQVIAGTPIGLYDAGLEKLSFSTLVLDEAGQCIEPLAWCVFPLAPKRILAGDHWQLPPTVLSNEAVLQGYNTSILEHAVSKTPNVFLLNTQYRMREAIAGFSSAFFYNNLLLTAEHLLNQGTHLTFIDTAGAGYEEERGADGTSLQNPGELQTIQKLLEREPFDLRHTAFISPYAGQVTAARTQLPAALRFSTIDSFQGQEQESIIISLVRSNDDGEIGFLKDYRRMNVAITRAKEQLVIIGDSATIGADAFYNQFLSYVETHGTYRTVWEFEL